MAKDDEEKKVNSTNVKEKVAAANNTTAKQIEPNKTTTQDEFLNNGTLDIIALNNELNSKANGEIRFSVTGIGNYEFDAVDKEGNPEIDQRTGEQKRIVSPYIDIVGEGVDGRLGTKHFQDKRMIEGLDVGQSYYAHFRLTAKMEIKINTVVPFNQELTTRVKHMQQTNTRGF